MKKLTANEINEMIANNDFEQSAIYEGENLENLVAYCYNFPNVEGDYIAPIYNDYYYWIDNAYDSWENIESQMELI